MFRMRSSAVAVWAGALLALPLFAQAPASEGPATAAAADEWRLVELEPKIHRTWKIRLPAEAWTAVENRVDLGEALGASFATRISGTTLEVDTDGDGEFDAKVSGKAGFLTFKGEDSRYAMRLKNEGTWSFAPSSSMQGELGGARLRIIDQNGNGRFDDVGGDAIVVGAGNNAAYLSTVVSVPEGLFEIQVAPHGRSLLARPYRGKAGRIALDWDTAARPLQAVFVNADRTVSVDLADAGKEGLAVPAGEYVLAIGELGLASSRVQVHRGRLESFDVPAGGTTKLPLGGPLTAEFGLQRGGGQIQFSPYDISYFGRNGERYIGWQPDGKSPRIVIRVAKTGREIAEAYFPGSA
ncbi:MAG: hypothetical protein R3F20_06640 [Planctomycetota bacterium]